MAWLAALSLSRGRKAAFMAVAGVSTGLLLLGLMAAAGLGTLIATSPELYQALRTFGVLYLLWLAYDTWRSPQPEESEFGSFRDGLITNLLNPKAGMFYISVLPAFLDPAKGAVSTQTLILVLAYIAVATAVHAAIVIFASAARSALGIESRMTLVRRALALGLVAVALWFFWSTR
jgi:threonine/homoserine/homoserine lactone efflux protein